MNNIETPKEEAERIKQETAYEEYDDECSICKEIYKRPEYQEFFGVCESCSLLITHKPKI